MIQIYQMQLCGCPNIRKPPAKGISGPFCGKFPCQTVPYSYCFGVVPYCLCKRDIMLRVHLLVVFPDLEVYMRPGSIAGVTGKGNPFPLFYDIAY